MPEVSHGPPERAYASRADPDALLRRIQAEEARARRGQLKVFFGAAPGVGKTYAMLEAAQRARAEGKEVVVGFIESHGRQETEALLDDLEVLPRRRVTYRGKEIDEFDLDTALRRKPRLLLVDELAHTNTPGLRHPKRWLDVVELLDAGIDVWTTLNVQHLESLNDVIAQITGVRVRETLPDAVLEQASEMELVDLPHEALVLRLREGKVYPPEMARRAETSFFKKGNLLALRELALRRTAERVDADVLAHRRDEGIQQTWHVAEHILVAVGPTPTSATLVRAARRMAAGLRARWTAVSVEDPHRRLTEADRERLAANLRLAEQLGAQVVSLSGHSVSEEVLAWSRAHNVTRIVLGKPTHPRWRDVVFGSLLDEVVRGSGDIEVHAIAGVPAPSPGGPKPAPAHAPLQLEPPRHYLAAAGAVALATVIALLLYDHVELTELTMVYLLAMVAVATRFGRGPSLLAAALSVAAYDFVCTEPRFTFTVHDAKHLLTFAAMFVVGVVISTLTRRNRQQADHARAREQRTAALYALARELAKARDASQILTSVRTHLAPLFDVQLSVLLAQGDGLHDGPTFGDFAPDERDRSVAAWVYEHDQPAGLTTDTLSAARALFLPLSTGARVVGVLGLLPANPARLAEPEPRQLLDTFCQLVAAAIDRVQLADEAQSARLRADREELRNTLLSSVSHDLRTPLAAITGAATTLLDAGTASEATRHDLLETIRDEADRLNRLVGNLLDMTRLESGALQVRKEWTPLEEVVGSALDRLAHALHGREVEVDLPPDLPLVRLDAVLIEQVLLNLLDNAVKHTPEGAPIEIHARAEPGRVEVDVADRGPGVLAGNEDRLFDKFFRAPAETGPRGTGLGLAICKGIVQAHGGTIEARNRGEGGAVFRFTLPLDVAPPAPPAEG